MATLMIASNLPDIDVAVFATDTLAMSFRRGWTHGVLAMMVLPGVLALLMFAYGRFRARGASLAAGESREGTEAWRSHLTRLCLRLVRLRKLRLRQSLVSWFSPRLVSVAITEGRDSAVSSCCPYTGNTLHVFMDWLNSYGVRLLKPFSDRWFYGDALCIIDPILYVLFAVAIVLSRRAAKRGSATPWHSARLALAVAAVYITVMVASNWWARVEVRSQLARAGRADARFMVTPVLGNPLRREVIVVVGDRYEKGALWFEPFPHFRPLGYGVDTRASDPAVVRAREVPRMQAFLMWSRFPFFVVESAGERTRVVVNDYRYSGPSARDGWATQVIDVP